MSKICSGVTTACCIVNSILPGGGHWKRAENVDFEKILAHFPDAKRNGDGWIANCLAHDDKTPSLSIKQGADGRTLLHCHAGCTPEAVCASIGITTADLFAPKSVPRKSKFNIIANYDYHDEIGNLLFQVCRLDPKGFKQRKPDASAKAGWRWKMFGVRRVPFRLPELLAAVADGRPVFVAEGEKDVLALVAAGFAATTNPGGAGKWQRDYADYFKRADVFIIADKDEAGRKHAQRVAENLHSIAASVRVFELPDISGKPVKDAADFFAAGGQAADLDEIAQTAPAWEPAPAVELPGAGAGEFEKLTAEMRGEIIGWLMSKEDAGKIRNEVAKLVVGTLAKIGRFYFHADLRDFDSALFFNRFTKRLERISSDVFRAWLSDWIAINRAEHIFKFTVAAVETAALSGKLTTGILPETFWAARPGAIYLSNGDGALVKITAGKVEVADNGTDDVLFAAGKTLAPWKITAPRDIFETCKLFREVHCAASHGKVLLQLWLFSVPTNPRSKPPLCAAGDIGSGKTRTIKGIAEFYGIPFIAQKVEEDAETHFWPCINEGGIYCLDNADTKCRWLADAIANAATDGCSQRRKLYTNSETVTLRARAWLAVTSANPSFAADAGLSDRLLPVRMDRREGETSDAKLSDEIAGNRDAGLSYLCQTLSKALADTVPVPTGLNDRHPDFASFAVRIGRALGREAESIAALKTAEADKSAFCLENDAIGAALIAHLSKAGQFSGTSADLLPKLIAADAELEGRLSAKRLGKRLVALWPHLQKILATAKQEKDRNHLTSYTFKAKAADCAEFQTDFSIKSSREEIP